MLACKDLKKQFSSVIRKTKIGFHVVNFNGERNYVDCFKKAFVKQLISFLFFSTYSHLSTLSINLRKNFVTDINGK